jgi:hypothetical protein
MQPFKAQADALTPYEKRSKLGSEVKKRTKQDKDEEDSVMTDSSFLDDDDAYKRIK